MSKDADPKGLIRESYRIDGIGDAECRSILVDWALSLPAGLDAGEALRAQYGRYAPDHPDHPMTAVLREGLHASAKPVRRGGARARRDARDGGSGGG